MPSHHAQDADAAGDLPVVRMLRGQYLFQPVFYRLELRAQQSGLNLFQQLLHGKQCIELMRIKPDTRRFKWSGIPRFIIIAVTFAVIDQRRIEIKA